MLRVLITIVLLCSVSTVFAQQEDNPFDRFTAQSVDDSWIIPHRVEPGETIFMLSRRYHVPPAILSRVNGMSFQSGLTEDSIINIPVGAYNIKSVKPINSAETKELYYKVSDYDNLFKISRYAGVSQSKIKEWNNLDDNLVIPGKEIFVGWLLYDATQLPVGTDTLVRTKRGSGIRVEKQEVAAAVNDPDGYNNMESLIPKDTVIVIKKVDSVSEEEKLYMWQTSDESIVANEKGKGVFFDMNGKVSGSSTFYAFHNEAKRGTIIKVFNPGTQMHVFVKVIGPIPETALYHNSIIGISSGAKESLGVSEDKVWCELTYHPMF